MPFSDGAEPAGLAPQIAPEIQVNVPAPPFGKLFEAAVERDNPYVSTIDAARQPAAAPFDASYDPFKNIQGYEDYASSFVGANSDDDVLHVKTRIDSERRRSDLLASGGWRGTVAAIGAGLADPLMLLPIGGEAIAVTRAGRLLEGALRGGATFGGLTAAQEAVLGGTQITRPFGESAANVATSTLLGGVLGGALGAWGGPITRDVAASAMRAGETFDRELGGNVLPFGPVRSVIDTGNERTIISGSREALRTEIRVPDPITAFHGSPRDDLDRLDRVFIGTGEGNQTYGHGLYAAEEPKVSSVYQGSGGSLYGVRLHVDALLDLDAPLAQQPASVRAAIAKAAEGMPRRGFREPGATLRPVWLERALNPDSTGENVYRALSRALGGDDQASQALARSGIQGLRYFDEASRKAGAGTRNYVVFDDARIELASKNGEPIQSAAPERSVAGGGSVGAAVPRDTTLEQETIANALGVDKALAFSSPTLRLGTSPSVETRRIGLQLADQPLDLRGNAEGIATPISVEQIIKQAQAPLAEALVDLDDAFVKYRLGRDRRPLDLAGIGVRDLVRTPTGAMSYDEFREAVGKAMRRGDASDIPEVSQAATALRSKVFDPLKEKAVAQGLLPEDVSVDTALSYLTRVYDQSKIVARREDFTGRITRWLGDEQGKKDAIRSQIAGLLEERKDLDAKVKKRLSQIETQTRAEQRVEIRREEVSRLNAFAFKRSSAMSKPVDELRASIATTHAQIAPQLERLSELAQGIRAAKDTLPGLREIEAAMFRLIGAGGKLKEGGELVDLVRGGEEFGKAIEDLRATVRGGIAAKSLEGKLARQAPEAADLVALEQARAAISKTIRPYRKELQRLQRELKTEMRARGGPARGGAVFETEIRRRGNTLADQASGRSAAIESIEARLGPNQERLAAIQAEIERLVASWEGNTSRNAKGAIARRTEKEATRAPDANRLKEADKPVIKAAKAIEKANTKLDELDLRDTARQIIDRILGSPVGRLPYDMEVPAPRSAPRPDTPPPRGPLAHRAFAIPDNLIEGFLDSDVMRIARTYSRTMAADTALAERFGRTDMQDQFQKVMAHYETLRAGITDERALKKLDKSMRDDLRDLAAVRDRIRGTYGLPDNPNGLANRSYHVVRDLNYLRLLGGMTVSAFPDLGRTVMTHGIMRVVGDGIVPMLRDFKQFRLSANEAKLSGTALDMTLDTRAMSMADMLDDYGRWSKYERGLKAMTEKFGLVSLMAPWNAWVKQFVGVVSQTRSLQAIERMVAGGVVSQAERTRLASLGIGADAAERIDAMFKAHGEKRNGVWWANTAAWEDTAAAETYRGALGKEIDTTIVTPGQERPLWMTGSRGNIGRMIGQFHSFSIASTQRVLMTGLQKRDMATLNGTLLMTALGMLTYFVKHQANPDAKPLPDPSTASGAAQWLREGVDRAGLIGWLFDAHNIVEKATRGTVGLSKLTGGPEMSRYASRGVVGALLGPTFGLGEDAVTSLGSASAGEWTHANSSAVRRMLPFQNLIGVRHLFDLAEHGLNQSLGVHETVH